MIFDRDCYRNLIISYDDPPDHPINIDRNLSRNSRRILPSISGHSRAGFILEILLFQYEDLLQSRIRLNIEISVKLKEID